MDENTLKKEKEFMCPKCGNEDDQVTEDSCLYDEYYIYKMYCPKCECEYTDYYKTVYDYTYLDIDKNI